MVDNLTNPFLYFTKVKYFTALSVNKTQNVFQNISIYDKVIIFNIYSWLLFRHTQKKYIYTEDETNIVLLNYSCDCNKMKRF